MSRCALHTCPLPCFSVCGVEKTQRTRSYLSFFKCRRSLFYRRVIAFLLCCAVICECNYHALSRLGPAPACVKWRGDKRFHTSMSVPAKRGQRAMRYENTAGLVVVLHIQEVVRLVSFARGIYLYADKESQFMIIIHESRHECGSSGKNNFVYVQIK